MAVQYVNRISAAQMSYEREGGARIIWIVGVGDPQTARYVIG